MKITIPPEGKFTRVDDGVYVDEKGNHYQEERVLRYKVLRQRTDETEDVWQLHSSHSSKQNAIINRDSLEEEEQTLQFETVEEPVTFGLSTAPKPPYYKPPETEERLNTALKILPAGKYSCA